MTLQRRHFELIAETLNEASVLVEKGRMTAEGHIELCHAFAGTLHQTNPNFNRARFLKACGVEQ